MPKKKKQETYSKHTPAKMREKAQAQKRKRRGLKSSYKKTGG